MNVQERVMKGNTGAVTTNGDVTLVKAFDAPGNLHGLRVEFNIESEVMDANSNGWWDVYLLPGNIIVESDLPQTWSEMDDKETSQYLWGSGLWMASNQTPAHVVFAPKTSRNVVDATRILCRAEVEGTVPVLTNNRINIMMTGFISS